MIENGNTNSKIWEIKELSQAIKNTIENSFEFIRLKGEISKPSFPSSGHIYFALKDDKTEYNRIDFIETEYYLYRKIFL